MSFMFENLEIYQKAVNFADNTISLTRNVPYRYYFLTDQLNRAALSIATNIAEGNGRFTKADKKNFFIIARGSIQECVALLEITRRKGFINQKIYDESYDNLETLAKMISGLIKTKTGK